MTPTHKLTHRNDRQNSSPSPGSKAAGLLSCPLNVVPQYGAVDINPSVIITAFDGTTFIPLSWVLYLSFDHRIVFGVIKSRRIRWAGHVALTKLREGAYMFVGKPEGKGKRPLGRSKLECKDNIKMDLKEVGWTGMDWIVLAQDRDSWRAVLNVVMNFRVHKMLGIS